MTAPMSLMPTSRFTDDSIRSPRIPPTLTISPSATRWAGWSSAEPRKTKWPIRAVADVVRTTAPSAPPRVLFGLVLGASFRWPSVLPEAREHIVHLHGQEQPREDRPEAGVVGEERQV